MKNSSLLIVALGFLAGVGATLLIVKDDGQQEAALAGEGSIPAETGTSHSGGAGTGLAQAEQGTRAATGRETPSADNIPDGERTTLEGKVYDTDGEPIEGASVYGDQHIHVTATSDTDGHFLLPAAGAAWPRKVFAEHPQFQSATVVVAPREEHTERYIEIVMQSGASICVDVLGPYGEAVPEAQVTMGRKGQVRPGPVIGSDAEKRIYDRMLLAQGIQLRSSITDDRGRACLGGLESGSSWVEVSADGYPMLRVEDFVDLGEGLHDPVSVTLQGGWSVQGHVRDPDGNPVEDAKVEGVFAIQFQESETGKAGTFLLEGFPGDPGPGELRVIHPDFAVFWAVLDGGDLDHQITLRPSRSLDLQFVQEDGMSISGEVRVSFQAEPGRALQYPGPHDKRFNVEGGSLRLDDVHTQVDKLVVSVPSYTAVEMLTSEPWSGLRSETLVLERSAKELAVRLFSTDGKPFGHPVKITLTASRTDEGGRLLVGTKELNLVPDANGDAWISADLVDTSGDLTISAKAAGMASPVVQIHYSGTEGFPDRCELTLNKL